MHQQHSGRHAQGNILRRCMQIIAVISLLALIKRDVDSSLHPQHRGVPFDFRATYCGEYVTARHGNPYLSQPLRSCEIAVDDKLQFPLPDEALPATLPPYAQIALSPLGLLGEPNAQRIFFVLSFAALLATIWAVSRLSLMPLALVTTPLVFGVYEPSSKLGAVAMLATAGVALTALLYERKRYFASAAAFCLTMLQPQTGLVLFIALFVKEAKMRVPLAVAALVLGALCLPMSGEIVSYFQALAIHSRAEQYQNGQLSLTYLVRHLGTPEMQASQIGSAAYLVWVIAAVVAVMRRTQRDAFDVLLPAMIAVLPGSFVQTIYLAPAIIPALICVRRYQSIAAFAGLAILSTVWQPLLKPSYDLYLAMSLCGVVLVAINEFSPKQRFLSAGVYAIAALAFCGLFQHSLPPEPRVALPLAEPRFASSEWYIYLVNQTGPTFDTWMQKVLWLGALLCVIAAAVKKRTSRDEPRVMDTCRGEFQASGAAVMERGLL